MSAGRILAGVVVVFLATAGVQALLGQSPAERLLEVVAAALISYVVFSLAIGRIRLTFLLLVTAVFVALVAADTYLAATPLLSGPLAWFLVPAVVAALLMAGRRMAGRRDDGWHR